MNDSNMAANIFGRYVWLIDILYRYKRLTFQEINELWQKSGLGNGEKLPLRTFHSHQSAIKDVFDVYIECDYKDGFRYYIDEKGRLNGNNLRHWLISSYAALNQMRIDNQLEERILFEDISSGQAWLTCIAEAMRNNHVLSITYQGFGKEGVNTFEIEPYFLKSVKHRWYVVAHNPYYPVESEEKDFRPRGVYLIYALDRISNIQDTGKTFKMDENFDVNLFFEGCCGVLTSRGKIVRVVIRTSNKFAEYLRFLPLHKSQRELSSSGGSTFFEYYVKLTSDFYQLILAQNDKVEIISPSYVRRKMLKLAKKMMVFYGKEEDNLCGR
jgi:predicted DNA-binding transcriptional regulator YafY